MSENLSEKLQAIFKRIAAAKPEERADEEKKLLEEFIEVAIHEDFKLELLEEQFSAEVTILRNQVAKKPPAEGVFYKAKLKKLDENGKYEMTATLHDMAVAYGMKKLAETLSQVSRDGYLNISISSDDSDQPGSEAAQMLQLFVKGITKKTAAADQDHLISKYLPRSSPVSLAEMCEMQFIKV